MANIVTDALNGFTSFIDGSHAFRVFSLIVILAITSLFIYAFYKSTSKRDIIKLDLDRYNYSKHPITSKFFATLFYLIEYIIIIPFILILWFAALSIVLLVIASNRTIDEILYVSAALVGAIRILAYFKGEISQDLAKLFPFIALSVFILSPRIFDLALITGKLAEIPQLVRSIFSFIIVVLAVEIFLRVLSTLADFWRSEENVVSFEE